MAKAITALELPLADPPTHATVAEWLYQALRKAIMDGRLKPSVRLPATRDLARQHRLARGTVVSVYEQLLVEGYLTARTGAGTYVSERLPEDIKPVPRFVVSAGTSCAMRASVVRPFRPYEPAVELFPIDVWTRLTRRRWHRAGREFLHAGHLGGFGPLRVAVAEYLGSARGVRCVPEQVVVVTGTQQALDLIARVVLRPGDRVWMEDPGYPGAVLALRNAGANVVGVPVDGEGLDVAGGRRRAPSAALAYVTPAHQFPLGVAMSAARRTALLDWAAEAGAYVLEDDYDSEYRWASRPIPALQGADGHDRVIFVGSFNKVLFTSLRLGYIVVPPSLVDAVLKVRYETDRWITTMNQAVLTDFIVEGHLGRHIRRARRVYQDRLGAFTASAERYLGDAFRIPAIGAGLATPMFYDLPVPSTRLEAAADARGVEALALARFSLDGRDIRGMLLGFGAFDPVQIDDGAKRLAAAAEACIKELHI
jgi:GntR family transcriptional regulator/MocR family aminotransferase